LHAFERHSLIQRALRSPAFGDGESARLFVEARRLQLQEGSLASFIGFGLALLWLSARVLMAARPHYVPAAASIWVIVVLMGGCLWATRRAGSYAAVRACAVGMFALSGLGIVTGLHGLGGATSPAYVWLALWAFSVASFTSFSLAEGAAVFGVALAGYLISAVTGWAELHVATFIGNLAATLGAMLIALLALRRREWQTCETFLSCREWQQSEDELDAYRVRLVRSERLAMVGALAAGVSHEFNNLLTTISGRAELASMGGGPADLDKSLRVILESTRRGAQVAGGLLSFSRSSSQNRSLLDVNDLLQETLSLFRKQFSYEDTQVSAELSAGLPPVWVNRNQMQRVLATLFLNAQERMERGGALLVTTRPASGVADAIEIVISDEGARIDAARPERPPGMALASDGVAPGRMGLSMARGLILSHGGDLQVERVDGVNRCVIQLPAGARQPDAHPPDARFVIDVPVDEDPRVAVAPIGLDICIVHSDAGVRDALARVLAASGHRVAALEHVGRTMTHPGDARVDLMVCGQGAGAAEARRLHRQLCRRGEAMRYIVLLDDDAPGTVEEAISLGAWTALPAPVAALDLLRLLRRVEASVATEGSLRASVFAKKPAKC
jgi:signal transduction histidine kinase/ActR/RegA family two-component response regulator